MTDTPLPAPPASESEAIVWLQLIRSRRVGPGTFRRLLDEFGGAAQALAALPDIARKAGVSKYTACARDLAAREYETGTALGARLICLGSPRYPALLARISDAPPVLWQRGQVAVLNRPAVALVGARNASSLGTRMARLLARGIGGNGHIIVSGLARGIDTAAHLATLETGTIAVMAGGVDFIYPRENHRLAGDILEHGALLSEQPIGLAPQARHFPRRNRLVSGLSQAVVVVEAAAKSGSLITAREAADQGREVLAVPGHPLDTRATGCNMLIRDGAVLVRSGEDVLAALARPEIVQPEPVAAPAPEEPKATIPEAMDLSRRILSLLGPSPLPEDQLIREIGRPAQEVAGQLVSLELEGKLCRQTGGMLARVV
jgi:DNA processing protein